MGSTSALATTPVLSTVVTAIGISFLRGTYTNWQLIQNDAAGTPTLTDLGVSFLIASTTNVLPVILLATGCVPTPRNSAWLSWHICRRGISLTFKALGL